MHPETLHVRGPAPAPPDPTATELRGQVAEVTHKFANADETLTVIARLAATDTVVRGNVDSAAELRPGGWFLFGGRWDEHPRHGWQFNFEVFTPDLPAGDDATVAYLAQLCPGVGPATARKLVDAYGEAAPRVLAEDPARAAADGLLRPDVAEEAGAALRAVCDPRLRDAHVELFALFKGLGFPRRLTARCLELWGAEAPVRVRRDPFTLLVRGLPGCGFLRVDRLYLAMGRPPHRLKRQALAAWHALRKRDGDTWVTLATALDAVRSQVAGCDVRPHRAVLLALRARRLTYRPGPGGSHWVAESGKARSENALARRLKSLRAAPADWPAVPPDRLSEHQRAELAVALSGPVGLLTGSPGTGKTYTAAEVIRGIVARHGWDCVAVAAPTGKAAVRIGEKLQEAGIGGVQPSTVHRLLQVRQGGDGGWRFAHDEKNPLSFPFVVVDESSMLDADLAAALLRACAANTHVLFVGDQHQLPPVGHGAPLRDMLAAGLPAARLSEIRRNSGLIVEGCAAIKDARPFHAEDRLDNSDAVRNLIRLPARGAEALAARLSTALDWLAAQHRWDLVEDVQVLSARNATRRRLNKELQQRLNPGGAQGTRMFRVGDKVINLRNGFFGCAVGRPSDREYVANGDVGRVERFRGRTMVVRLRAPDRLVVVPLGKTDGDADPDSEDAEAETGCSWTLAYCCTAHKFQGSECPVVIVLMEPAGPIASREWLYTAISRAKTLCVLIGDGAEVKRYCQNTILPRRKTFLAELLRGELP
jgi:exodeoxyribonuclease V alpha subunit